MENQGYAESRRSLADGAWLVARALVTVVVGGVTLITMGVAATMVGPILAIQVYTPAVAAWWAVFTAVVVQGVPFLLLVLSGVAVLRISLFSDLYLRYMQAGLRPYLIVSGVLLLAVGIAGAALTKWWAPDAHEHDSGHDDGRVMATSTLVSRLRRSGSVPSTVR
ncbi:hypothetical protein OG762_20015 [Streptomyces sp. NBC_01136]|uniref:hypothetical protein n=1 Tax=unclassified Streptomyces TaxID=2593676 RepID=UPI0032522F2C|nr:hypothetical protein OG762_20015 [Streptomyces sp. NBC_01136]